MPTHTYCRLCEGYCGLTLNGSGSAASFAADPSDPVSEGYVCDTAHRSLDAIRAPDRIHQPMKRVDGRLVPATWDEAISDIGARLRAIRGKTGPSSVALHLGDPVQRSSGVLFRSLAFGLGMGTPNIYSTLVEGAGPRLHLTERMVGHPVQLLPDLGRAHYVVLLGADFRQSTWGPGNAGQAHEKGIAFSRKTKGTKVVVADPRKTELAAAMDQHLPIRPGTEPFFLLGMLAATVKGEWRDRQYVDDYTRNYSQLGDLLAAWPLDRCADICGVPAAGLSGVGLKFSRAAMAVLHAGPSAFANIYGGVGAWAWLALHTLTANTLRPGGLYEHRGFIDTHSVLAAMPIEGAPTTRVDNYPMLTLQAPETALPGDILTPGEGQVRALICVSGNPAGTLPAASHTRKALASLDLLVCLARHEDETAAQAHWVLPIPHPWEREDTTLHDAALLPVHGALRAPPVLTAPADVRPEEDILRDLFAAIRPGLRGATWGQHMAMGGNLLARANLKTWEERLLRWVAEDAPARLSEEPHRIHIGDTDRSGWRVSTPDGRIDLLPEEIATAVRAMTPPPREAERPLLLRTSRPVDRAPDRWHRGPADDRVALHPDLGFADNAEVRISTRYGSVRARVRVDPALRADTVDLATALRPDALDLLSPDRRCPITGAPERDGVPCAVSSA